MCNLYDFQETDAAGNVQHNTSHDMTNQQNECAPSEDSDQPWHPPSLISVFAVRSVGS